MFSTVLLDPDLPFEVLSQIVSLTNVLMTNCIRSIAALFQRPGEKTMYFFTRPTYRDPHYRVAGNGYWKETVGRDIPIGSEEDPIGYQKTLVYYEFKRNYYDPNGDIMLNLCNQYKYHGNYSEEDVIKTSWIMHECRINDKRSLPRTQWEAYLMQVPYLAFITLIVCHINFILKILIVTIFLLFFFRRINGFCARSISRRPNTRIRMS